LAGAALLSASLGVGVASAKPLYYITVVPATSESGVDTGVSFNAGQTVSVRAQGYIQRYQHATGTLQTPDRRQPGYFSPAGALGPDGSATDPNCQLGQLLGMIAGTGTWHWPGQDRQLSWRTEPAI